MEIEFTTLSCFHALLHCHAVFMMLCQVSSDFLINLTYWDKYSGFSHLTRCVILCNIADQHLSVQTRETLYAVTSQTLSDHVS